MFKRHKKVNVSEVICCEKVRERISQKIPIVFQVWEWYWSIFIHPSIAKRVRKKFSKRGLKPKGPIFGFEGSGIDVYKINYSGMDLNFITPKASRALFTELGEILNIRLEVEYLSLPPLSTASYGEGEQK